MKRFALILCCLALIGCVSVAETGSDSVRRARPARTTKVQLVIETWSTTTARKWETDVLPAFEEAHPDIDVVMLPTHAPRYDDEVRTRLNNDAGGDLIFCRPFNRSQELFNDGRLEDLSSYNLDLIFDQHALRPWSTDDGSAQYCVPTASVVHGFLFNEDIFTELGLDPPETMPDLFTALETIEADGRFLPLAISTTEPWRVGDALFQTIGPNYWGGEEGRQELGTGTMNFSDDRFVDLFTDIERMGQFVSPANGFDDAKAAGTFDDGQAAIFPAGSWELVQRESKAEFRVGAFPPPRRQADATCHTIDHPDFGLGVNANSRYPDEARLFIEWAMTSQFSELVAESLEGYYPLLPSEPHLRSPLARTFGSWRQECESSARLGPELQRGSVDFEKEAWTQTLDVLTGKTTGEGAVAKLQDLLEEHRTDQDS